jgi:FAD/FMN-containing dehydrogenase
MKASAVDDFRSRLRGDVLGPDDTGYEDARRVYNGMIDRRPRLIARCANSADVIASVDFARDHRLELAVRGGGHNVAGFATCDDGLVLDLSTMRRVRVDPTTRTAWVEGGCTWGDFDHATHPFGLATPGGIFSTTGVGGLTLGGGIGYLARRYGLSCDNLLSADVVTADGCLLTASPDEHDDLFWALRGGGGNFGVVTSFEFRLHPVDTVLGGAVFYPADAAADVLRFYLEVMAGAPQELGLLFGFVVGARAPYVPEHLQGVPMCTIVGCHSGPMGEAEADLRPIRRFGPPALDLMGPMPYPDLQSMFDPFYPPGLALYEKSDFVYEVTAEAIAAHLEYGPRLPTPLSLMLLYPTDGAIHAARRNDTAFSYRDTNFAHIIAAIDPEPAVTRRHAEWVRQYWQALHPLSAGGTYVNWLMEEGDERIATCYRDNHARLATVKGKYDPENLFHMNHNIQPKDLPV